jgi:hypothetical protein
VRGEELRPFDRVRQVGVPWNGEWTVLPLDDGLRWLGRRDGSLIPVIPDEHYELL